VNLTNNPALDWNPAWSPDGSRIAFTTYRAGGGEIFAMNADGSNPVRLTTNSFYDRHPRWSSDGTRIAFESYRGGNWEILVMNADGSGEVQLTHNTAYDFEPDWSPDSTKITWRTGQFDGVGDVAVMNADGTGVVNLTNDPVYDREPAWSPDGNSIAYASVQSGNFDIRKMDPNGTGKVTLTTSPGSDYDPDWSTATGTPTMFSLTVAKQGTGAGSVRSQPAGIRCGTDCQQAYPSGTVVVLRAFPFTGSRFTGWSGACTGTAPCTVTMNAARNVVARFART
jgi:Tol biopolymer transport system component